MAYLHQQYKSHILLALQREFGRETRCWFSLLRWRICNHQTSYTVALTVLFWSYMHYAHQRKRKQKYISTAVRFVSVLTSPPNSIRPKQAAIISKFHAVTFRYNVGPSNNHSKLWWPTRNVNNDFATGIWVIIYICEAGRVDYDSQSGLGEIMISSEEWRINVLCNNTVIGLNTSINTVTNKGNVEGVLQCVWRSLHCESSLCTWNT